jgi:hypothetical protein
MFPQLSESANNEQLLRRLSRIYFVMFENPGVTVWHKHGVNSGG